MKIAAQTIEIHTTITKLVHKHYGSVYNLIINSRPSAEGINFVHISFCPVNTNNSIELEIHKYIITLLRFTLQVEEAPRTTDLNTMNNFVTSLSVVQQLLV